VKDKSPQRIINAIQNIRLSQGPWEDGHDVVFVNGRPASGTIPPGNLHLQSWWPSVRAEIARIVVESVDKTKYPTREERIIM